MGSHGAYCFWALNWGSAWGGQGVVKGAYTRCFQEPLQWDACMEGSRGAYWCWDLAGGREGCSQGV